MPVDSGNQVRRNFINRTDYKFQEQAKGVKMAMMLKPKSEAAAVVVPEGTYKAMLSNITQFQNVYGERIGFEFTLQGNGVDGQKVMRSTNPVLTPKSKLAEVLAGLLGRELTAEELSGGFDVSRLVGKTCNVLVLKSRSKNGAVYSNVERIFQAAA